MATRPTDQQIMMARDLLLLVANGETAVDPGDEETRLIMGVAADTLDWVLGQESSLPGLLDGLKSKLAEHDQEIVPRPEIVN